jgi:hypothetical protein
MKGNIMFKPSRKNVKTVAKAIVGFSTSFVASNVIRNNTTPGDSKVNKAAVVVGSGVAGLMFADAAEAWTDRQVDAVFDIFSKEDADSVNLRSV